MEPISLTPPTEFCISHEPKKVFICQLRKARPISILLIHGFLIQTHELKGLEKMATLPMPDINITGIKVILHLLFDIEHLRLKHPQLQRRLLQSGEG